MFLIRWAVALDQRFFFFLHNDIAEWLSHDFQDQPTFPFTLPCDQTLFACCRKTICQNSIKQAIYDYNRDVFIALNRAGGFLFHSRGDVSVNPHPQQIPRAVGPPSSTTCAPDSPPPQVTTGEKIGQRHPLSMQKLYNVHFTCISK